jgi:hypothetical protein
MQGLPPEEEYSPFPPSPNNPSNEGAINESIDSDVGIVAHPDHQLEGVVEDIVELPSSTRHFDQFSAFHW